MKFTQFLAATAIAVIAAFASSANAETITSATSVSSDGSTANSFAYDASGIKDLSANTYIVQTSSLNPWTGLPISDTQVSASASATEPTATIPAPF